MTRLYHVFAGVLSLFVTSSAAAEPAPRPPSHQGEVETFAATMAVAQMASDQCADILINMPMLKAIRDEMHYVEAVDGPAMVKHGRWVTDVLRQAIADSGKQAWCDAAYRMYGPNGKLVPRLMLRR